MGKNEKPGNEGNAANQPSSPSQKLNLEVATIAIKVQMINGQMGRLDISHNLKSWQVVARILMNSLGLAIDELTKELKGDKQIISPNPRGIIAPL